MIYFRIRGTAVLLFPGADRTDQPRGFKIEAAPAGGVAGAAINVVPEGTVLAARPYNATDAVLFLRTRDRSKPRAASRLVSFVFWGLARSAGIEIEKPPPG